MTRADHHAGSVKEIAIALVGAIVWRMDDGTEIQVMTRDGEAKNVLWVVINDRRYALVYNHDTWMIDLRQDTIQGMTIESFDNSTPLAKVVTVFQSL